MNRTRAALLLVLCAAALPARAQPAHPDAPAAASAGAPTDSADVAAAAERFSAAIVGADRAAVEALLLADAVVLEGGMPETKAEYLAHHFAADAAFMAAMERTPGTWRVRVAGEAAWVASTSRLRGTTAAGRVLDLDSAELLVLRRTADGWRIAAVHWSSGARK